MAIIFIPGIKATALANANRFDFKLIYDNYDTLGASIGSTILGVRLEEQLNLNPKHDYLPQNIIERNHIMSYPYENSMRDIKTYTGEIVYLFGYDWRKSNAYNALLLADFVNNLKEKLNETSFNFITHSMGAMVLGCYLKNLNGNYSTINKIVFTAPPFKGGMEALKHMAMGDGGIRGFLHLDEGSRKAVRTYPAIYELCPWYDKAVQDENGKEIDLALRENWQTSIYDDDNMEKIFPARIQSMVEFRKNQFIDLSTLPQEVRDKCLVVAGTGSKTLQEVKLIEDNPTKKHYDFKNPVWTDYGDCTVPLVSSTIYKDVIKTITVEKGSLFMEGLSTVNYHALFLTDSRVLNIVKRFIKGNTGDDDWHKSIGNDAEIKLLA